MKGHTTLKQLQKDALRHAECIRERSPTLEDKTLQTYLDKVSRQTTSKVMHRLLRLESKPTAPVLPIEDRDVHADITFNGLVTKSGGLCIQGVLLNYPVPAIVGSFITTKPIIRYFRYRNYHYVETTTRWFRVHGDVAIFEGTDIPEEKVT